LRWRMRRAVDKLRQKFCLAAVHRHFLARPVSVNTTVLILGYIHQDTGKMTGTEFAANPDEA